MSVNIRDYASNDHIESIAEIAKSQSAIIQALSIDNSKLQQEIQRKDNIINELKKWLEDYIKLFDSPDILEEQTLEDLKEVLGKINELEGDNK